MVRNPKGEILLKKKNNNNKSQKLGKSDRAFWKIFGSQLIENTIPMNWIPGKRFHVVI